MADETVKQTLNRRALASLFLFFTFMLIPVSGIPLHFLSERKDPGLLAHLCMTVHNVSSLIFLIAVVFHLFFNWRSITHYMYDKCRENLKYKKEMLLALCCIAAVVSIVSSHVFHTHQ